MAEGATSEPAPRARATAADADEVTIPRQGSGSSGTATVPDGRAHLRPARRQAVLRVVEEWAAGGWPARLPSRSAREVQGPLEGFVACTFPEQFSREVRASIVLVTLRAFLAQAQTSAPGEAPTADDLVHAVMNEALDRIESGDPLRPSLRSRAIQSGSRDQEIVWEVFGNHVSRQAVLDALRVTLSRRETFEFHVVTKYLDLTDVGTSRPPLSRVVEALQEVGRDLGLATVTEAEVQSALFRFCNRLPHDE